MKLLKNKKLVTLAAMAALAAFAAAAVTGYINGRLGAGQSKTWYGTYTRGWLSVDVDGSGFGDLDLYVFDEDGTLLAKDDAADNDPCVEFFIPYTQRIDVVVANNGDAPSSYSGVVE